MAKVELRNVYKSYGTTEITGRFLSTSWEIPTGVTPKYYAQGPGNDLCAVTALAGAGAQIILFTTGRGTPFGSPVPTIKVSTNSNLAARKKNWIDFDAGRLLSGRKMAALTEELKALVLAVAGGVETKAEIAGDRGIAIFKSGVTL